MRAPNECDLVTTQTSCHSISTTATCMTITVRTCVLIKWILLALYLFICTISTLAFSIYSRNYTEKQIWIRFTGRFGWNRNCLCIFFSVFNSFGFMQINYRCVPFRQYYPIYINLYINSVPSLFTNMHNMQYEPSSRCVVCCVSNVERIN